MNIVQIAQRPWRIKTIIILLVCSLMAIIGFYFFVRPPLTTQHQYQSLMKTAEQRWQYLQNPLVTTNTRISSANLQRLQSHIVNDELITTTTQLAMHAGLILLSLQPSTQHQLNNLVVERFTLTASGDFKQIMRFYQALLRLPYWLTLSSWQLSSVHAPSLKLKLLIEVYHYQH